MAAAQSERPVNFSIPAQDLGVSLNQFARQSDYLIVFSTEAASGRPAPALQGDLPPERALAMLLDGSGLTFRREGDAFLVVQAGEGGAPQDPSAAGEGAEVEALVVTAQKREEAIQDVPIAISAFTQKDLEAQKIEGGFDLLKAIPNVTFSKSNFSSYNFSIRGVGTKAISATTDPGVAVAFNNTTLIQNRLFEQEYFDIERVEVLRGPQGTLYGRNATSGVINVITAKPDLNDFEGSLKFEMGNYDSRRAVAMVNIPIVDDMLAVRLAGALTKRTGYDYNEITRNNINGRDLWSGRVTVGFEPIPTLRANLLWERFEEDDNRSRTSKQLCHRDPGPQMIGSKPTVNVPGLPYSELAGPARFSQGCLPGSLYDDA
ncbi:MAG TPA: TonB-dependent receptor, partial [Caulobacteraceae bacterium]|nr:TonB-dependent receptor [Caulobacteraceae bacterium]